MQAFRAIATVAVVVLITCMSGCATIVKGHSQQVTLTTDPPGAACTLVRDGKTIGTVNPTPGTATVDKSRNDIAVSCSKEGYHPAAGKLTSTFQPMTFGNILFGGLIGVGVDAASGAMNEYEPSVAMTLIPAEFDSAAQRDAFFDKMRSGFNAEAEQTFAKLSKRCSGAADCARKRAAAEKTRDEALAGLEDQRAAAKIKPAFANAPSAETAPQRP